MMLEPRIALLMAELKNATDTIIEKHWDEDEKGANVLKYHGPFSIVISGQDGVVARFYEEGIEFYPKEEKK